MSLLLLVREDSGLDMHPRCFGSASVFIAWCLVSCYRFDLAGQNGTPWRQIGACNSAPVFFRKDRRWGVKFMPWLDVVADNNGWLKDDKLLLTLSVLLY